MEERFDCIVIGAGPGGYVAAIRASQLGMKTAVVEREESLGGRCLNFACIPAKAVLRTADVLSELRTAEDVGLRVAEPVVDFAAVQARRARVVGRLTTGVAGLLKKSSVEVILGRGRLGGAGRVVVDDRVLRATTAIILATGSNPKALPGVDFGGPVMGTEDAWALDELPRTLAVVGAGASGSEIASAYARLGSDVLLFEALERVLPTEDADISAIAAGRFRKQGIAVHTNTLLRDVQRDGSGVTFAYGEEQGWADLLVIAAGRSPDTEALGADSVGIRRDQHGMIEVDAALRTSVPGIWAIGDLVHGPALAHKASEEGIVAVEDAAGLKTHPISYTNIPRATFCSPNVASFGLTEVQAREAGHDVTVGKVRFGAVGAGTIYDAREGMVKIVGDRRHRELLGGHIVGPRATELIQELVNVTLLDGGYPEVARAIHSHPTLSEAVMEASRAADGWLIHG